MKKNAAIKTMLVALTFFVGGVIVHGQATNTDLRSQIEGKARELQGIQAQKEAIEKNLEEVGKSRDSLKKEIKTIDGNISQLNLSIKANKLTIEKLDLEIDTLGGDIDKLSDSIANKKTTLQKLFTELQERERENFLIVFLRNRSLSQSVDEMQSIERLNGLLAKNVSELRFLQSDLTDKLDTAQYKKHSKEVERTNLSNRQQIVQEQKQGKQVLLNQTKNQEKIYATQLSEIEKLQEAVSAEIEKIESELRKTIDPNLLPLPRPFVLLKPVVNARVTQGYGNTPDALRLYRGKYHNGVDFGAPLGTEVFSAESGTVINVGDQDRFCRKGAYGKFIVVKHDNGLTTLYAHLSRYIVSVGQKVERGEVIGYVGRTGYATGPHLHLTVFASQTLVPARPGYPEGTKPSTSCGPMPVGGDLDPTKYL